MHAIDRLAEIRAQMRILRNEAHHIEHLIATGEVGLKGDEHQGRIRRQLMLCRHDRSLGDLRGNCEELA